jgi:hypothetical protein
MEFAHLVLLGAPVAPTALLVLNALYLRQTTMMAPVTAQMVITSLILLLDTASNVLNIQHHALLQMLVHLARLTSPS